MEHIFSIFKHSPPSRLFREHLVEALVGISSSIDQYDLHIWMLQFHNILFVELLKLCGVDGNCEFKREHFQFMPSASAAFI